MTLKYKIIISIIVVATAYAFGRYSAPEKVKTVVQTVEVEKKVTDTQTDRDKHKKTVVHEVTKPDGTKETTTEITEDTNTDRKTSSTTDDTKTASQVTEVTKSGKRLNISAMAGAPIDFTKPVSPIIGAEVSTNLIGPVRLGVWGLNNATGGVTIGLDF